MRFTTATAARAFTSEPTHRPRAQNGSAPSVSVAHSRAQRQASRRTPPAKAANALSASITASANTMLVSTRPIKCTAIGIGETRFRRSQPMSSSIAMPTPKPNSAGPITAKAPKVASR